VSISDRTSARFERLAARLGAHRPWAPAFHERYWEAVRELFTRDVTGEGLRELLQREAHDTFRFFTKEVPLDDLAGRPFYERWPQAVWRTFLAMAYRLNPWRRVVFAVAVPLLAFFWLKWGLQSAASGEQLWTIPPLLLLGATALFFLLALELRDKLSLKGDLEVARQIQFGLLPFEPFSQEGFDVRTTMRPANTVGGDYFDLLDIGPRHLAVVVGDVAGKGMPAALLMALLQGSLRTLLTAGFRGEGLLVKLNAHLCANIPRNRLVTFFYGELDLATGELVYINGGHNPPYLLVPGQGARPLPATGPALGILEDARFGSERVRLAPGDRLFLYTDGITEAENPADDPYGDSRLVAYLTAHREDPGQALIDGLIKDVLGFCGVAHPRDDMTVLCVTRATVPGSAASS
jgi:hypothetical protein